MNITVYCGANMGRDNHYREAAERLGQWIASSGHRLVYGGGKAGLMGVVADTVLEYGGEVIGIIPTFMVERELAHEGVTRLEYVDTMSERKKRMVDLGEAYIALPGGTGTLEEITEVISWAQLGQNGHPCVLFNMDGFYSDLREMYDHMVEEGFLAPDHRKVVLFSDDLDEVNRFICSYKPPLNSVLDK